MPDAVWGDIWRSNVVTGERVKVHDKSQIFTISFENDVPIDEIISELKQMEEVEYAHQPIEVVEFASPDDPLFSQQWNLTKINAAKAWDITKGSDQIKIAILEGRGVKTTHADLSSKIATGSDVNFTYTHGTQVAGVAGAATNNNNTGVASLGWNIKLLALNWGNDEPTLETKIYNAITQGAKIINCSFGTGRTTEQFDCRKSINKPCYVWNSYSYDIIEDAIEEAILQGIVVVAATGNLSENTTVTDFQISCKPECDIFPYIPYPASYIFPNLNNAGVIGVSATDVNDIFAGSSAYNYGDFVDLSAPGIGVLTTSYNTSTLADGYATVNGTSFASPHVAALAALVLSLNPTLTPLQVQSIMENPNTCIDLGSSGKDVYYGSGRIDAYKALKYTLENYGGTLAQSFTIPVGETWNF